MDKEIETITQPEPFLVINGKIGDSPQYLLYYEKRLIFESKTLLDALLDIFAIYYNFDICYNKATLPILLFFQCHAFKINKLENKRIPDSLVKFIQLADSTV